MNEARIDLQQLRIKHILYKSKVRSIAYGGAFDEDFFSTTGPINSWFENIGEKKYGAEQEMRDLRQLNTNLSSSASKVRLLYQSGKLDEAHEQLKEVEKLSVQFQALIDRLEWRLAN